MSLPISKGKTKSEWLFCSMFWHVSACFGMMWPDVVCFWLFGSSTLEMLRAFLRSACCSRSKTAY